MQLEEKQRGLYNVNNLENEAWSDLVSAMTRLSECLSDSNQEKIRPKMDEFFKTLHEGLLDSKKERSCQ